ncbi:MAG: L-threonine 3-dehydrogenase [Clostridiales bacterium]|jgi:threonine 3-dehydrogenase|nr:L-threonine 3-dehydrogenase [Clostridiales bacterium]
MTKTMQAIWKARPEANGLELRETPIPEIKDNEVLVKIRKTAICGTDVHIYSWNDWAQRVIKTPMIIGHEFAGRIVQVGKNVDGLEEGMLVSGEGHVVCGKCRNCITGKPHLCKNTKGIGVNTTGIFAEYAAIPASNIWVCDESISEDVISCFDPLGNAVHTALSFDMVGEDILITGAGPIGIMAVAIAKHIGARNIVVTDMNKYRLDMAMQMGATKVIDVSKEKIEDCYKELKMKEGFDVGLEMSGSRAGFSSMVEHMHNGGKIALLGLIPNDTQIDWDKVIFNGLLIKGIYGREMFNTWYKMTAMIQSGLDISPIITHRFDYKDFQKGFEAMISGQSGKVVLNWE